MVKKIVCSAALLAALMLLFAGLVVAQDRSQIKPTATIGEQVLVRPMRGVLKSPFRVLQQSPLEPAYCSPCLFYGGDGNPSSPTADGLWDNNSADFGISGVIYTPFAVPKKTDKCGGACAWVVSGIGGNIEMSPFPPNIIAQDWSIVTGVASGGTPSSTTVLCSGTDSSPTLTDTGRLFFGVFEEFNVTAHVSGCPSLTGSSKAGTPYWQTNPVDTGNGFFQLAYESSVDVPATNPFGPAEPVDESFFYSPFFGFSTFTNPNTLGVTGSFRLFSTDIEGSLGRKK